MKILKQAFDYRGLLYNLVLKELKARYRVAGLGFLWAILNPLLMMAVLSIVFILFLKIKIENYPIFVLAGLLPWIFFHSSLSAATTSFVDNGNLLKKIYFPRALLPISIILADLINLFFSLIVFFVFLLIFKINFTWLILFFPIVIFVQILLMVSLTLITAVLNAYWRDVKYIVNALLLIWFYLTPVIYPLSFIPKEITRFYLLNPLAGIITAFRDSLLYGRLSNPESFLVSLIISLVLFFLSIFIFQKYKDNIADVV